MFFRLVIIAITFQLATALNFCEVQCKRGNNYFNHTMCLRPKCPLENTCAKLKQIPLTNIEKALIVSTHNKYRNIVAQGKAKGLPKSSNMNELVWDEELAKIAQCWANACKLEHDRCRKLPDEEIGQNVGMIGSTKSLASVSDKSALAKVIKHWYDENKYIKRNVIKSFVSSKSYGHFSQLAWGTSKRVGCGRVFGYKNKGKNRKSHRLYLVCNYGEAGNWKRESVYLEGKACSKCTCSKKFNALCKNSKK